MRASTVSVFVLLALGLPVQARIVRITLSPTEPFADGASFGEAGAYERLHGQAHGELDPADPRIADMALAPRNANGKVEYAADFFMLRPKDATRGSHALVYEVLNRGRKFLFNWILDAPAQAAQAVNDPRSLADAGDALPLRRGDTIVWSGWEADALRQKGGMAIDVPVATADGKVGGPPIVATVRDELVSGTRGLPEAAFVLTFHAATSDKATAHLTFRDRQADVAAPIPDSGWDYVDAQHIELLPKGTMPKPGAIYDFTYQATGPKVLGIGFAATRDVVAALRGDGPLARELLRGAIEHTVALGISQSGRFLRDSIHQGFNQDEDGRKVFDGVLGHISGAGGVFLNARFGQPSRTATQHEDHLYPEAVFPFSTAMQHDPITGLTGSLLRRDGFDPLLMETNTSTEYWQKGASLLTTDPKGEHDVALPANVRAYLIASGFHYGRPGLSDAKGPCANPRNTLSPAPALRALLVDLEDWVVKGVEPPASRLPTLSEKTLVPANATGFPAIPGFEVPHGADAIERFDTYVDPVVEGGPKYRILVPKTDAVGNDAPGIRLPEIEAPMATRTGWNLYGAPFPTGELCDRDGSMLALAKTDDAKTPGDPRPSLASLYPRAGDYAARVERAADRLVADRLLLQEDAARSVSATKQGKAGGSDR